ncbi:MAG: hypothetical protein CV087_06700 [Candidatus Brocadia sp. WS118]|nr:MAG: hypothetical protein CV087_06700 [Candidatus Brocadia sp. WS118]
MKHNIGSVSLERPKRMNIKISVHWIFKSILTLAYAFFIYYESSQDTSSVPLPTYSDKLIHFMVFGLLCLLICWTFSTAPIGSKLIHKITLAIGITSLYGVSDEFHQFFTPHRSVDIFDWVADTAGAVAAGFLWLAITNKLQMKEKVLNVGNTSYQGKE